MSKHDEWIALLTVARQVACAAVGKSPLTQEEHDALSNMEVYEAPRWDLNPFMYVWVRKKPAAKRVHDKSVPSIMRSPGISYRKDIKVPAPAFWPGGVLPKQYVELIP